MQKYLEQIGATCNNCGNRGVKGKCNRQCINSDSRTGWDPAPGIRVREYGIWQGMKRGFGREVISDGRQEAIV